MGKVISLGNKLIEKEMAHYNQDICGLINKEPEGELCKGYISRQCQGCEVVKYIPEAKKMWTKYLMTGSVD